MKKVILFQRKNFTIINNKSCSFGLCPQVSLRLLRTENGKKVSKIYMRMERVMRRIERYINKADPSKSEKMNVKNNKINSPYFANFFFENLSIGVETFG